MKKIITHIFDRLGLVSKTRVAQLESELTTWKSGFVPPGHYYSPLNDLASLESNSDTLFHRLSVISDVDLRTEEQKLFLENLSRHYVKLSFPEKASPGYRYYYGNNLFSYSDAIMLFCILNELKPLRCIEIGSGYSSALMLDTNERHLGNSVQLTFIEPYPEERLFKLIKKEDKATVIKNFVQNVNLSEFGTLQSGDILFVDSSHISKFDSDLNHILFKVLPLIADGVYIHFHDVFFPFEYPKEWILSGRAWNEAYLLRAFLMNNDRYEIVLFPSMMELYHESWLRDNMPLTLNLHEKWPGEENFQYYLPNRGQSLWLRKKERVKS